MKFFSNLLFSTIDAPTLSIAYIIHLYLLVPVLGWFLYFYLFFTRFYWISVLYSIWLYYDRNTFEQGGRISQWILNWKVFHHSKAYFPTKLILAKGFTLDSTKNYLFCCFPHGVLPYGPYLSILTNSSDFTRLYPDFTKYCCSLHGLGYAPFSRYFYLGGGFISCSVNSLNYVLSRPKKKQIVILFPGGAAEVYNSVKKQYKVVIRRRKGFIRVALQNGASLVPVFTFGEMDIYNCLDIGFLRPLQDFVKKVFGFFPVLFYGRGLVPLRKPLITIVGKPIHVEKIENPNSEQIDLFHERFMQDLRKLFDEYKNEYLENPDQELEFE